MSCQFEFTFPNSSEIVAERPLSVGRQTMFEQFVTVLLNLVQPSKLPIEEVISVNFTKQGNITIEPNGNIEDLLTLAMKYEIPIAVTAILPFAVTVIMGICLCIACTCLPESKHSYDDKMEARKKLRAMPVMFLFFSATMLVFATYTMTSNLSLDVVISKLLDDLSKSANYSEARVNASKKIVDRLVTTDFELFVKGVKNIIEDSFTEIKQQLMNARDYENYTAKPCLHNYGAHSSGPCGYRIQELLKLVEEIEKAKPWTAPQTVRDLAWRATEPLTAVRQLFDSLLSSIPSTKELADIISNNRPLIEEYNTYRHIGVITWSALACATSFFLFTFAVLLLFVFGPEGGCCHVQVPEKCIKKLLALSACIAKWTALLGSVMFLVLFSVGANVHNACQRLEDVEDLREFIGTFSNVINDYLRWLVNSSFVKSGDISSASLLDAHEIDTVIKAINVTDIVQKCKERKTVFVILNSNSLNLTAKLSNMFSTSVQAHSSRRKRRPSSLLCQNQGPLGALSQSSYKVQDESSESLPQFFGASTELPFGGGISLLQSFLASHQPQTGKRSTVKLAKNLPFSKPAGRLHGNTFEVTKRTESSTIKLKQLFLEQETGRAHFAEYEAQKAHLHLQNTKLVADGTTFGRFLSKRQISLASCNKECVDLRQCKENYTRIVFRRFGRVCSDPEKIKVKHEEIMENVIRICENIKETCNMQRSSIPLKAKLLENVPTYARHISGAFENDILPCDALTYFVRSAFNSTCRDALHRINCWSVAVGLWCLLAAFTVCFGMSASKLLLGPKPKKTSERTSNSISL